MLNWSHFGGQKSGTVCRKCENWVWSLTPKILLLVIYPMEMIRDMHQDLQIRVYLSLLKMIYNFLKQN